MNHHNEVFSIPIDIFKDKCVLLFGLMSMHDATENCDYPELVRDPHKLNWS